MRPIYEFGVGAATAGKWKCRAVGSARQEFDRRELSIDFYPNPASVGLLGQKLIYGVTCLVLGAADAGNTTRTMRQLHAIETDIRAFRGRSRTIIQTSNEAIGVICGLLFMVFLPLLYSPCASNVLFPCGCRNDIEMSSSHKSRTWAGLHICRDLRYNS
jgi:hypothetical protein